jgi:hypothetical protein
VEGTLGHAGWRPCFSQISNKEYLGKGFGSGLIGETEQEFNGVDDYEIPNQLTVYTRTKYNVPRYASHLSRPGRNFGYPYSFTPQPP